MASSEGLRYKLFKMRHLGKNVNQSSGVRTESYRIPKAASPIRPPYLMRQHRFKAAAEVAEVIAVLVHLHTLAVVLDLRVHSVRTFLHGVLD